MNGTGGRDGGLFGYLTDGFANALDNAAFLVPTGAPQAEYHHIEYRAFSRRAAKFAAALTEMDVKAADRVVVCVDKSIDAVALYLACLQVGAIYVPLNPGFTAEEVSFFVDDSEPSLVIVDPARSDSDSGLGLRFGHPSRVETMGSSGEGTVPALVNDMAELSEVSRRGGEDIAAMLYTSGTTGRSKGAMMSHGALIANAFALREGWAFTSEDVLVHALPIFHTHGLFVALHCSLATGSKVIFLPRFDVDDVLGALRRGTVMMGVPTYYSRLLSDPRLEPSTVAAMRLFTSGSAPMTETVHAEFESRTGHRILERYGMTETGIISSNPLHGERIGGTVGFALDGFELRVTNESGPVPNGATGVVEVRGPHTFSGYWGLPERTAADHTDDGFFVTGDIGTLDAAGRLTLEGRAGDMIISGGENVYPKEIEMCLDEVDGVVESAVVGVRDIDLGEVVTAFVVVDDDCDTSGIAAAAEGRLARYKRPRRYVIVDALPRNAMGKIQKSLLRSQEERTTNASIPLENDDANRSTRG